ncbi:MAG: hypothetical protein QOI97_202 [Pseudomonas sp.]|jgi:hypothetical protein|nr:hypothetical protein [Pseudomonas sp.]
MMASRLTQIYLMPGDPNVGAGLLANTLYQPMRTLTDTPLSRASPLPHKVRFHIKQVVLV